MLTAKKIALFGTANISMIAAAGTACINLVETKSYQDALKIAEPVHYRTLVKAYMKVKRKYYPEKDLLINNKK